MKNTSFSYLYLLLFICLCSISAQAQRTPEQKGHSDHLSWFDEQVGLENTALYEGIIYREKYRTINDRVKFFQSSQWLNGSVIYSGQLFTDLQLKYDVFEDQLLIKQLDRLGGGAMFLFKDKVSSFVIEGTQFVNIIDPSIDNSLNGYLELLWSNDIRLFAKHRKDDFVRKDRRATYYEFIDRKKEYLLQIGNEHFPINSKRDIQLLFPVLKKEVDSFYQKNKRLRTRDMDAFMISFVQTFESQINQRTSRSEL